MKLSPRLDWRHVNDDSNVGLADIPCAGVHLERWGKCHSLKALHPIALDLGRPPTFGSSELHSSARELCDRDDTRASSDDQLVAGEAGTLHRVLDRVREEIYDG